METRVLLDNPTPPPGTLHHTLSMTLIDPDGEQCGQDRRQPSSTVYNAPASGDDLNSMS